MELFIRNFSFLLLILFLFSSLVTIISGLTDTDTKNEKVREFIVDSFNDLRKNVKPTPSNMLKLRWNKNAQERVENRLSQCTFTYIGTPAERNSTRFGVCSRISYVSPSLNTWSDVVDYLLHDNQFEYGMAEPMPNKANIFSVAIASNSHSIGCAVTRCDKGAPNDNPYYLYMCEFCPGSVRVQQKTKPYEAGEACAKCPNDCDNGLCTNYCPYTNLISNCDELYEKQPNLLCHGRGDKGNYHREICRASCSCQGKIY